MKIISNTTLRLGAGFALSFVMLTMSTPPSYAADTPQAVSLESQTKASDESDLINVFCEYDGWGRPYNCVYCPPQGDICYIFT